MLFFSYDVANVRITDQEILKLESKQWSKQWQTTLIL